MDWDDPEEIGRALVNTYPDIEPLSIRFSELRRLVLDLDEFEGDSGGSNRTRLDTILMAWLDEYESA